jgi:hypothetical protein
MSEQKPALEYQKHDPIERAHDDEPHFVLLARDALSPDMTRYYGAARAHNFTAMDAIHARMKATIAKRPLNFDKDRAHQRSAAAVAINMELWAEQRRIEAETAGEDDGRAQDT